MVHPDVPDTLPRQLAETMAIEIGMYWNTE